MSGGLGNMGEAALALAGLAFLAIGLSAFGDWLVNGWRAIERELDAEEGWRSWSDYSAPAPDRDDPAALRKDGLL